MRQGIYRLEHCSFLSSIPSWPQPMGLSLRPADHDESEKTFLGETGNWNGDDILDIICKQPATARFISRHLYNFFVADDVQIPAWRLTPTQDAELIRAMEKAYFDSGYDITAMLRTLLTSASFKSEPVRYAKVKNPAEMVVGTLRMVEDHREIKPGLFELSQEPKYMGMDLMNPPRWKGGIPVVSGLTAARWWSESIMLPIC